MSLDWPVHWFDTVDSTNEEAKRRAAGGVFGGQWIAAREQTSGRGRLGRPWISPPGNLYATALFPWPLGQAEAARVPLAAGVAVSGALQAFAPHAKLGLKWPNDVRAEGRKISGILTEAGGGVDARWVALGVGINVAAAPASVDQPATSLADLRGDTAVRAEDVLEALRERFEAAFAKALQSAAFIQSDWLPLAEGLGQPVSVAVGESRKTGVFEGVAPDGAMLLRLEDGGRDMIRAGDVSLVKEAAPPC